MSCGHCPRVRFGLRGRCDGQANPTLCRHTDPAAPQYHAGLVWKVCGFYPGHPEAPDWLPPLDGFTPAQVAAKALALDPRPAPSGRLAQARELARLVAECPHRGDELPEDQQPQCNCPLRRLRACQAGRGEVSGRVTELDCHDCASGRLARQAAG
jgi:hypothetical protein